MKAYEVNELSIKNRLIIKQTYLNESFEWLMNSINEAIEEGRFSVYRDWGVYPEHITKLESLGYYIKQNRTRTSFEIFWGKEADKLKEKSKHKWYNFFK